MHKFAVGAIGKLEVGFDMVILLILCVEPLSGCGRKETLQNAR